MKSFSIKKSKTSGKGLFSNKFFKKDKKLMHVDLTNEKNHTLKEWKNIPHDPSHMDYVGRGKYIVSFKPYSYMNHSCNPNTFVIHKSIAVSDIFAMKDIKRGEELTYDYRVNAMDMVDNKKDYVMQCKCKSKNCRKTIHMNFFRQPLETKRKYFKFLPPSIKRRLKNQAG